MGCRAAVLTLAAPATRDDDQYFYPATSYAKAAAGNGFAVRWTGQIVAPETGTYKIATVIDDGARLWVDGKQLVDNWTDHGPTADTGYIDLVAGRRYDVRMEYYQGGGGAEARLRWQMPARPGAGGGAGGGAGAEEIIPTRALAAFPTARPGSCPPATALTASRSPLTSCRRSGSRGCRSCRGRCRASWSTRIRTTSSP